MGEVFIEPDPSYISSHLILKACIWDGCYTFDFVNKSQNVRCINNLHITALINTNY